MQRGRRAWYSFLVDWAVRLRGDRPDAAEIEQRRRRADYDTDVSRLPLRMTGFLRDRLRRRWLRLRKD